MALRSGFNIRIFYFALLLTPFIGLTTNDAYAKGSKGMNAKGVALAYAAALANGKVAEWASLDLGCLMREKGQPQSKGSQKSERQQACWDDTMQAHRKLAEQEADSGVFGSSSLAGNFGLLHERHRVAATWREYPPAIFVSPAVAHVSGGPAPKIQFLKATAAEPVPLVRLKGDNAVTVSGVGVEIKVTYEDPFRAPLALRPEEPWSAKGVTRKFGPVHNVTARFVVVSGLRKLGLSVDTAVLNEALPDAPGIPYAQYGMNPDPGRRWVRPGADSDHPPLLGGFVLGSARWWTAEEAGDHFHEAVAKLKTLPSGPARAHLVSRLRTLAPQNSELNAVIGDIYYEDFLAEASAKSGIKTEDADMRARSLELFWTLQAQTWRQELTAVSNEYEPAATALFGAIGAYEVVLRNGTATTEQRRRLGALYRWNNDSDSALQTHEQLLKELGATSPRSGRILSEIAWDKIQWVSWNRKYDHPWLGQALQEAKEAEERSHGPADKLMAAYARLVAEALHVPRNGPAVEQQLQAVKSWHEQTAKTEGLWALLVGNDVVKSLFAEGATVSLPVPTRSEEVADIRVHAQAPKQDLLRVWNFDSDVPGKGPEGFTIHVTGSNPIAEWQIAQDAAAPSQPNVLAPAGTCKSEPCFHFVTTELKGYEYPDVTAQVVFSGETPDQGAGVVVGAEGSTTLYFVVLNPVEAMVRFYRVQDGQVTLLASEAVRLRTKPWHSLRAQRVNFLHINRPTLAAYIDGFMVSITPEDIIPPIDRYGLVVQGDTKVKFDSLHVLDLVTNRPMSKPAAY